VFSSTYKDLLYRSAKRDRTYPTKYYGYYGADIGIKKDGTMILFDTNQGPSLSAENDLDFQLKFKIKVAKISYHLDVTIHDYLVKLVLAPHSFYSHFYWIGISEVFFDFSNQETTIVIMNNFLNIFKK
jgi:hypothetical protein